MLDGGSRDHTLPAREMQGGSTGQAKGQAGVACKEDKEHRVKSIKHCYHPRLPSFVSTLACGNQAQEQRRRVTFLPSLKHTPSMAPNQTTLARLQTVSGLALTTLLVLTCALAFLTYPSPSVLSTPNPQAALNVSGVQVLLGRNRWHMDRRQQEFLEVTFDGGVDLTGKTDLASFLTGSLPGMMSQGEGEGQEHNGKGKGQGKSKSVGRSLWNWNTKQVFLWLEVEWRDYAKGKGAEQGQGEGRLNRAVVWDRIVRRREDARVVLNGRNKYGVRVEGGKWR